ncbi:hypothetical protein AAVH_00348 [Aphelenchoides avenae]|nr:hypothetical protein AAVH_00348 [Aphelenchus avenae]
MSAAPGTSDGKTRNAQRPRRNYNVQDRNQRMVSNLLQRNLNITDDDQAKRRPKPKQAPTPRIVSMNSFEDAMERLRMSNSDVGVSISDIKPYLLHCKSTLTAEQCSELASALCQAALEFGNVSFVAELCTIVIDNQEFQAAMADKLTDLVATFVMESDAKLDSLPDLLANLLVTKWPRRYNHAVMDSNQILFTIISATMGWQQLVLEASAEKEEKEESDDETSAPPMDLVTKCAQAMCDLCNTAQRSLWLSHPELVDGFYAASKSLLVSNLHLPRSLRSALLQLQLSFVKWSTGNSLKATNVATQTDKTLPSPSKYEE